MEVGGVGERRPGADDGVNEWLVDVASVLSVCLSVLVFVDYGEQLLTLL